jgi:GT2 family glycosyltransferase
MTPLVHVIILNWNNARDTLACVAAVERQDYPNRRIIVVDNASEAADVAMLHAGDGRFELIRGDRNLGFAGGCNIGLWHAVANEAQYIWLLNNDAIIETGTLRSLLAFAESQPDAGLISPLLRDTVAPHQLDAFCGRFDRRLLTYEYTESIETARAWHAECPDQVTLAGTALLIRRTVVETIGGLDERLFAYWEDTDYSIRASVAGFPSRVHFDLAILHPKKHTYSDNVEAKAYYSYYMARNEILLLRKHGTLLQRFKALRWRFRQQRQVVERLGDSNAMAIKAVLAGIWDGWIGHGGGYDDGRRMPPPARWLLRV